MKAIISDRDSVCINCAGQIAKLLEFKPDAVIAVSSELCNEGLFDVIVSTCADGKIDFSEATIFSVCEFVSSPKLGVILEETLLRRINIEKSNCILLSEDNFEAYDRLVEEKGGLDLAVLSIGSDCRIGFNEPGTPFSSLTHIQKLGSSTKKEFLCLFENEEDVPARAITMGIKSLCSARNIMVLAVGRNKSDAVFNMFYARNDPAVPAAFLQLPMNVTVYADNEAADRL